MFYIDSQRTLTRRDSSLIVPKSRRSQDERYYDDVKNRGQSIGPLYSDSTASVWTRTKGSVQKELVTMLFESMLDYVVLSWDPIMPSKHESNADMEKTGSELTISSKKKKSLAQPKPSRTKRNRSKQELPDAQNDALQTSWWSAPDEKAIIHFLNGNKYEGNISMKCMHGEGRYQWADGTVYLGKFNDNVMCGKGMIQWKNDAWYEGDFAGNLRHGKGLYVDSRQQRSYAGEWDYGTKHGDGVICYTKYSKNTYDGQWVHVRMKKLGTLVNDIKRLCM